MCPKPLEVTRTSLTACYTSLCNSSYRNTYCLSKSLLVKHWWRLTSTPWTPSTSSSSTSHLHQSNGRKIQYSISKAQHIPETLFIHRKQFIHNVPAFISNARHNLIISIIFNNKNFIFFKISFLQNLFFIFFFYFFFLKKKICSKKFCEQCS